MSVSDPDLLVIGGGPAGMAAAVAAARRGVSTVLVDENPSLGGQIYRLPRVSGPQIPDPAPAGERLRAAVRDCAGSLELLSEAAVWGVFPGPELALEQRGEVLRLRPRRVVLAPGAHELVPPFPGWTLPGVMTPGAGQLLVKTMGVHPGQEVVLSGTGPFLLAVASQLLEAGVRVAAVFEAASRREWRSVPLAGWRTPGILREGWRYLRTLRRHGVRLQHGRMVTAVEGEDSVESVVHAPVDDQWVPDESRSERLAADTLLVGFGFVPRVQLAQLAGCDLQYRAELGGWIPARDDDLRTSVREFFSAGDGAGVAGALVAGWEGELAGLSAAADLGALSEVEHARERQRLQRRLRTVAPLRAALDRLSAPRAGLLRLLRDDTIVCRCEEVRWDEARPAIERGGNSFRSLKVMTRLGMGPCQSRFCWPSMARCVAQTCGRPIEEIGPASPRAPLRPVALGALARAAEPRP